MTKGQRIKRKRISLDYSQTDLADLAGISKQTLYKYENDIITNIPSDIVEKLSYYLQCSPVYIMGWETTERVPDRISDYAKRLSKLSKDQMEDVLQFIDFIEKKG